MRARLLHLPAIARAVGFALVAIIMIAAALHFRTASSRSGAQPPAPAAALDPLAAELKRCQLIAEQATDDPACEAAWAENRRRFFTYAPASSPTAPTKTFGR